MITNGAAGKKAEHMVEWNSMLYAVVADAIWRFDISGTAPGTGTDMTPARGLVNIRQLTIVNGQLFFLAERANTPGQQYLFRNNGTPGDLTEIKATLYSPNEYPTDNKCLAALAGGVVFAVVEDDGDLEPWYSDGTPAGTRRLVDRQRTPAGVWSGRAHSVNDRLFYNVQVNSGLRTLYAGDANPASLTILPSNNPGSHVLKYGDALYLRRRFNERIVNPNAVA